MVSNNSLAKARALNLPTREASLRRDPSVAHFWTSNRELLENAWQEWEIENKDNLLVPDETLLDPKLLKAVNEAWENPEKENAVADLTRYPTLEISEINALSPDVLLLSSEPYPFKERHIDELKKEMPDTQVVIVDGEYFSWYGSRLLKAPGYFNTLKLS